MRIDYFQITQRVKKQYARMMEPICQANDLTKNELDVLLFLHNNPEFDRAADIVAHRGMTKSHVSLSVSELEKKGLLMRLEDPEDRRAVRLKLSENACEIAEAGRQCQQAFFARLFTGLTPEDIAIWQDIVERVCRNIDNLT